MTHSLFDEVCPVSLDLLGALYRADQETLDLILSDLPEATRAKLAAYLYGRSHTNALGLRVAATCGGASLRRAAGLLGNALFEQSRQSDKPAAKAHPGARKGISLGGSRATAGW